MATTEEANLFSYRTLYDPSNNKLFSFKLVSFFFCFDLEVMGYYINDLLKQQRQNCKT